ncbi:phosphatidylinositol-glycan biosynthesis class W protein [Pelobates fuscus]|uniref:phosphatidylinositol-glycan biosynthesis class W protein n=1 Tax=Pelobates fuscus TaxID=191477 RepID=UPI002FE4DD6A
MATNQLKEAFISNLNGTTITEISVGLTVAPLCIICRGLVLVYYHQNCGERRQSWIAHFLLDFLLLIFPQVLSCTVLSDFLPLVPSAIATICVTLLYIIYKGRNNYTNKSFLQICKSLLNAQTENERVPSVTTFRVYVNVLTGIAILAVDFAVFPRRYAKTETYGTGVMDFGVGGFIFGNGLISPEARLRNPDSRSVSSRLLTQVLSVWPLIALGLGRLVSVKSIDYHEHVSEYGVHWNFFFTLAVVKLLAALLFTISPPQKSWVLAAIIISGYQLLLEVTNLKSFILNGSDGKGTRVGFLNANREGLFSAIGYLAIYMAGVHFGLYILKKRKVCKDWIKPFCNLVLAILFLFAIFFLFRAYIAPASRRVANLTFCVWVVAQCLFWLCLIMLSDLVLMFAQILVIGSKVPSTWKIDQSSYASKKRDTALKEVKKETHLCLISAVNRNQLLFFLQSNIMTGIVNMLIDTIHSSGVFSITVLMVYMFCNCIITYILHVKDITVKYW